MKNKKRIKLVASTTTWINHSDDQMPMFRPAMMNEYIIAWFTKEPSMKDVADRISIFIHYLEGQMDAKTFEIFSGHELYWEDQLTHNEGFQLHHGGGIDFVAQDLTQIELPEFIRDMLKTKK